MHCVAVLRCSHCSLSYGIVKKNDSEGYLNLGPGLPLYASNTLRIVIFLE